MTTSPEDEALRADIDRTIETGQSVQRGLEVDSFPADHTGPFKRLTVEMHFNRVESNRVLVEWALNREWIGAVPGPYTFTLYRGYAANDDNFVAVAETVDQPWLYDNQPVWPSKGSMVFYKVSLLDGNGTLWWSQGTHATSSFTRYDWTIAKEIVRKEHLLMRKRAGTPGWLLKRRLWGEPCTCVNPITGQIENSTCPICYGTGIEGGYYEAFEFWVTMNPSQRIVKLDSTQGMQTSIIETVRALAYPAAASNDVWVHANTGQRYIVLGDIVAAARHRGIDLVMNLRLEERSRSESLYDIPVPC